MMSKIKNNVHKFVWLIASLLSFGAPAIISHFNLVEYTFLLFVCILAVDVFLGLRILGKKFKKNAEANETIVSILATIFTITSISFAFIEIANAPIGSGILIGGAIIFSGILIWVYISKNYSTYTITCLGVIIMLISALLINPTYNYNRYNDQLLAISQISSKTYQDYNDNEKDLEFFRKLDRNEKEARINALLSDAYFVKNYKDGLLEKVFSELRHLNSYENELDYEKPLCGIHVGQPSTQILTPRRNVVEYIITAEAHGAENVSLRTERLAEFITVIGCDDYQLAYEKIDEGKIRLLVKINGGHSNKIYLHIREGFMKADDYIPPLEIKKTNMFIYWGWDIYVSFALCAGMLMLSIYNFSLSKKLEKKENTY